MGERSATHPLKNHAPTRPPVNLYDRTSELLTDHIDPLRDAVRKVHSNEIIAVG